jgi:hypothetical protein
MANDFKDLLSITNTGKSAGDEYTDQLQGIHDSITTNESNGNSAIGDMVEATLNMTTAQITYDTKSGMAKGASNQVKAGAAAVKKAAGGD